MTGLEIGMIAVVLMLALIYFGMHISIALMLVSFLAISALRNPELATRMVAAAANDSLGSYLYGVVPLFVLMGLLVVISGVGRDTFDVFQWFTRKIRGGLGIATVGANGIFASITGISVASAAVFTKVAVPEMRRHGYTSKFSVGVVAGSSVLGMLIPPSLLMIVYGVLAEQSVGRMFIAGIIPGILLAVSFCLVILLLAYFRPSFMLQPQGAVEDTVVMDETPLSLFLKLVPIFALMLLVLGGLYSGFFTPTEAGGVGAFGALLLALLKRRLSPSKFYQVLGETGYVAVSILFLILAASLYSRMLSLTGLPLAIAQWVTAMELTAYHFLFLYLLVVILMGCIIDSVSIMLIVLPIVLPIAQFFGMDLIWFGVLTVVAVEIGLITPPFGISVYTVKAALDDRTVPVKEIFKGVVPFFAAMMFVLLILALFPVLSTYLAYRY
ncbi:MULTISPECIES: TRAP transporter large permease [unclassified Halomonas]|uniref:TRAP transporter large permease n=1 Tax=unclassified Halomonas TaxID=2609666 RepID=UPI0006DB84B8|nr:MULTISPECIES: TRAP transporter large permease [unclassified Halomonas]KPQ22653.1 MAG: TRAP-type C4-dicarboxylate transport system, large permease component [Halomonas sp. HL-93]SBR45433.1 TRAP transporter, DctM subunit [Halomonas sp. HL-93]SNY98295.1 TRAP transporter, DctM subunit [Halomonas sp. hl-4]